MSVGAKQRALSLQPRRGTSTGTASSESTSGTASNSRTSLSRRRWFLSSGRQCVATEARFVSGWPCEYRCYNKKTASQLARPTQRVAVSVCYNRDAASQLYVCVFVWVATETLHVDRLGQLAEFEQESDTDSQQGSNTDPHSALQQRQGLSTRTARETMHRRLSNARRSPAKRHRACLCVGSSEIRHLDRLGRLGEFEQHSNTDSEALWVATAMVAPKPPAAKARAEASAG